jgi:hypothetical protein
MGWPSKKQQNKHQRQDQPIPSDALSEIAQVKQAEHPTFSKSTIG